MNATCSGAVALKVDKSCGQNGRATVAFARTAVVILDERPSYRRSCNGGTRCGKAFLISSPTVAPAIVEAFCKSASLQASLNCGGRTNTSANADTILRESLTG